MPIARWKMTRSTALRRPSRASEMTKSGWKRRKSSRPRASSSGKVGPTTLSKKEISYSNKFLRLKGRIRYSNWQLQESRRRIRARSSLWSHRCRKVKMTSNQVTPSWLRDLSLSRFKMVSLKTHTLSMGSATCKIVTSIHRQPQATLALKHLI